MVQDRCPDCAELARPLRANSGRADTLPDATRVLRFEDLALDIDLALCKSCGAMYLWQDRVSLSGSGNNDETTLRPLGSREQTIVRELLRAADEPGAPARVIAKAFAQVEWSLLRALLQRMAIRDRPAIAAMLDALIDKLYSNPPFNDTDILTSYVGWSHERAEQVLGRICSIELATVHAVDRVLAHCRQTLARARA